MDFVAVLRDLVPFFEARKIRFAVIGGVGLGGTECLERPKSTDFGSATVSSKRTEPLDLERDLPTTAEDVAALRRIRESRRLSFAEYLRFLSGLRMPDGAAPRKTHEGQEPFEL